MRVTTKLLLALALCLSGPALAQTSTDPASLISNFRTQHQEGRVKSDATLKSDCAGPGQRHGFKSQDGP